MTALNRMTALAIVFIVLGIVAIVEPFVAGLAVTALVGWLLLAGGIFHGVSVFSGGSFGHVLGQLLTAAVYVLGGVYFLGHPLLALGMLTLFVAAILFVEAALNLVTFVTLEREEGSWWLLANAFVSGLLAVMIWRQWPSASAWVLGTLFGINLLMHGISRLMLTGAVRTFRRRVA